MNTPVILGVELKEAGEEMAGLMGSDGVQWKQRFMIAAGVMELNGAKGLLENGNNGAGNTGTKVM